MVDIRKTVDFEREKIVSLKIVFPDIAETVLVIAKKEASSPKMVAVIEEYMETEDFKTRESDDVWGVVGHLIDEGLVLGVLNVESELVFA